jgi:hypothetical protein
MLDERGGSDEGLAAEDDVHEEEGGEGEQEEEGAGGEDLAEVGEVVAVVLFAEGGSEEVALGRWGGT